ncbi:MAG: TPM domain-containing protein [Acidobacteriota bacterium]|nr:TPM domain-containing protein [Acidobacteriota bacterium]
MGEPATRHLALLLSLLLALFAAAPALAAPTFPPLTGRVVDDAHVLSPATSSDLTAKLADLETKTGRQVVVVTLPSLQGYDIADYGYQLGRAWGIGQKGQNNGVLFIVVPSEHKVRIEVGYGLEPILTDALSSVILQEQVLPKFRSGDIEGGVVAGTDAIVSQLSADPQTASSNVRQAEQRSQSHGGVSFGAIFGFIVFFIVISGLFRRHGGGGMGWLLPMMILSSGRGGWGGGGWGGRGGGGGGGTLAGRNQASALAIGLAALYIVIALAAHVVFFGIVPVVTAVRAFRRREALAPLAAVAAGLSVVVAIAVIFHR